MALAGVEYNMKPAIFPRTILRLRPLLNLSFHHNHLGTQNILILTHKFPHCPTPLFFLPCKIVQQLSAYGLTQPFEDETYLLL